MRLREIMKKDVETVSTGTSAETARQQMRANRIRHLVVTAGSKMVGIVSDRDLDSLGSFRQTETIGEIMTTPVVVAGPTTTLREAANLLRGRTIGCLPIVEKGKLVGIVTTTDLIELLGRGAEHPSPVGRRPILKGRGPRRKTIELR